MMFKARILVTLIQRKGHRGRSKVTFKEFMFTSYLLIPNSSSESISHMSYLNEMMFRARIIFQKNISLLGYLLQVFALTNERHSLLSAPSNQHIFLLLLLFCFDFSTYDIKALHNEFNISLMPSTCSIS